MNLQERVKAILLTPRTEWAAIDGETATTASLYTGYVIPLAAIPALAAFLGGSLFGFRVLGATIRVPLGAGLRSAVVGYLLSLAAVWVLAFVIDALAPTFGGTKSPIQALKVAAYSCTAAWVAGVFQLVPALAFLGLLGLYSLYLVYLGLPVLMKAPQDKAIGYTVVVVVCAIVLFYVVSAIGDRVLRV